MNTSVKELLMAVEKHFKSEVIYGKGGFWVKGHGFITIAKARKLTGIEGTKRDATKRILPWGDYATIVMLNQPRSKSVIRHRKYVRKTRASKPGITRF